MTTTRQRRRRLGHDQRLLIMALLAGLPAVAVALVLLWTGDHLPKVSWTLTVLVLACWSGFSLALRHRVVYPLQTLSNLLAGLREGDSSVRARGATRDDPLGEVLLEANALAGILREQRLGALEATALLRKVMEEIDVAVLTFDDAHRLRLINRAGERLLGRAAEQLLGRTAEQIDLAACLEGQAPRVADMAFSGVAGRWEIRRSSFRQEGLPHQLLVLTDVSRPLREEERQAWQRLMRVLGHEINNSLAPIKSIAGSLGRLIGRTERPADWQEDATRGLEVIATRAEALTRFTAAYARLARLPQPRPTRLDLAEIVRRVSGLETRLPVVVAPGAPIHLQADGDQIEQLLINLVHNAADAAIETNGGVTVSWVASESHVDIRVDDEGAGLAQTTNLFVPFFTTKPGGSGIGLALSRQIAEGHNGTLTLANRVDRSGCRALLRLPLTPSLEAEAARHDRSRRGSTARPRDPASAPAGDQTPPSSRPS